MQRFMRKEALAAMRAIPRLDGNALKTRAKVVRLGVRPCDAAFAVQFSAYTQAKEGSFVESRVYA